MFANMNWCKLYFRRFFARMRIKRSFGNALSIVAVVRQFWEISTCIFHYKIHSLRSKNARCAENAFFSCKRNEARVHEKQACRRSSQRGVGFSGTALACVFESNRPLNDHFGLLFTVLNVVINGADPDRPIVDAPLCARACAGSHAMQSSRLSVVCWLTAPTSLRSN